MIKPEHLRSAQLSKYTYVSKQKVSFVRNPRELIVSYRGSLSKQEIMSFFRMQFVSILPDINVHKGYLQSFYESEHEVSRVIHAHEPESITFCGHSKGGCIAKIASVYFKLRYMNTTIACHTFGSPKVGDEGFVRIYNDIVDEKFNMAHANDIVCTLPHHFPPEKNVYMCKAVHKSPHRIQSYINTLTESLSA